MAAISGAHDLRVNTAHHQAIGRLGDGLVAVGWAEDGCVEAVEWADRRPVAGRRAVPPGGPARRRSPRTCGCSRTFLREAGEYRQRARRTGREASHVRPDRAWWTRPGRARDRATRHRCGRLGRPGRRVGDAAARRAGGDGAGADGLVVCPGFVNPLSHSYLSVLEDGTSLGELVQGVTTQIFGEGESMGPVPPAGRTALEREAATYGVEVTWTRLSEYLATVESSGCTQNVASLVGAETMRVLGVGYDDRPATAPELDAMREVLAEEMADGALGIGSSLIYAPGSYAGTEELVALCEVAGRYGGTYASHVRNEGAEPAAGDRRAARDRPAHRRARRALAPQGGRRARVAADGACTRQAPGRPRLAEYRSGRTSTPTPGAAPACPPTSRHAGTRAAPMPSTTGSPTPRPDS